MKKIWWLVYAGLCISVPQHVCSEMKLRNRDLSELSLDSKGKYETARSTSQRPSRGGALEASTLFSFDGSQLFISYEPDEIFLSDESSVKFTCAMLLAEMAAVDKLSKALENTFARCDVYSEGKHFMPSSLTAQVSFCSEEEGAVVSFLEGQIDRIVSEGITHDEAAIYRDTLLSFFSDLLKKDDSEEQKYIFKVMEKEFAESIPQISFMSFLQTARDYIAHVHVDEISYALYAYLDSKNRVLESISPDDLRDSFEAQESLPEGEMIAPHHDSLSGFLPMPSPERGGGFSSMKRGLSHQVNSSYGNENDFYQLPLSESDKKIIRKIICNMGEKNVFQLLLDKKDMEKMGKQIRHVHPMRFIGYILSDGTLRKHLSSISHNHFKWSGFMDGFKDRMKEEAKKGQLKPFLSGFSSLLNVDPSSIVSFIERGDYEGLVQHFI